MAFDVIPLPGVNLTLVYDALPLARINRDQLRKILNDPQMVVMDTPEMIMIFAPGRGLLIQIGDQRVRITDQTPAALNSADLAALARRIHASIADATLIAYGFNYDLLLKATGAQTPAQILKARFLPDEEQVALLVRGQIETVAPRLIFHRGKTRYDLIFQPEEEQLKAHANVHFAAASLPDLQELQRALSAEQQDLVALVGNLFPRN